MGRSMRIRITDGCGSSGVSWLCCEGEVFAVDDSVDAFLLLAQVEAPVVVEVAGGDEGAEPEDGLGTVEAPPCARYVHSVLDDVPACSLDDPGGDRPALAQRGGVAEMVLLVVQVAGALAGAGSFGGRVAGGGGPAADPGRDPAGRALQAPAGLVGHPFLRGTLPFVPEAPGAFPAVFPP